MPPAGYEPLASNDNELPTPRPHRPRMASVDLSHLDSAFKQWTASLAAKFKKQKSTETVKKTIHSSIFEPVDFQLLLSNPKTLDHNPPLSQATFDDMVKSVRAAIAAGVNPKLIAKGSSGSYFARAKNAETVHTVAVFKPKDEEPFGRLNPKTTKYIHRQLRWLIPFGRACLIPNLSYISEAAASLLDTRLQLHIVPRTQLVSLSSPAFFYDWLDRNAAKKGKPLPEKIGSMQLFMHGFTDASDFLRKHPWPGRAIADTFDDSSHRTSNLSRRLVSALKIVCGRTGDPDDDLYDEVEYEEERVLYVATETTESRPFYWTQSLQDSFREELEKLVILDYLMLNTDRGADNYMIKYCDGDHEKSLVDVAPSRSSSLPFMSRSDNHAGPSSTPAMGPSASTGSFFGDDPYRRPHMHIAAIDNSLSFPHEHPKGWRTYPYGWLYLPVNLIGLPFSAQTRNHFLALLTSKEWWEDTTYELQKLFKVDPDFHPKMFARQLAVIKGQAWNIVQSLQHDDEGGPLELTRRSKVLVWDDEVEISETDADEPPVMSSRMSISSGPLPRRRRSQSSSSDFPPPINRRVRPVPLATKFQRVHPGTKGIDILEHLERLDAVEASLQRLGVDEEYDDDEEIDVGESSSKSTAAAKPRMVSPTAAPTSPFTPPSSPPLPTVLEVPSAASSDVEEEDVAMLSKSLPGLSRLDGAPSLSLHGRWASHATAPPPLALLSPTDATRTVIVERLEQVTTTPLCSCW
ncbi:PI3K/PI4K domain-containing protein [Mycena kentingensis (nom. inval.)]|nr:PI3K/PI4K domain-containing protein [Mycena kentingensis (nom. inval.)]